MAKKETAKNVKETTSEEIVETIEKVENEVANTDEVETKNNEEIQSLKVVKPFKDKYTDIVYEEGTKLIIDKEINETIEVEKKVYKISEKRAKELKNSDFVK